jgi:hypothetical protein
MPLRVAGPLPGYHTFYAFKAYQGLMSLPDFALKAAVALRPVQPGTAQCLWLLVTSRLLHYATVAVVH